MIPGQWNNGNLLPIPGISDFPGNFLNNLLHNFHIKFHIDSIFISGHLVHFLKLNDTGKLENSGATMNGSCIGNDTCTLENSGADNHGPGSVDSGIKLILFI